MGQTYIGSFASFLVKKCMSWIHLANSGQIVMELALVDIGRFLFPAASCQKVNALVMSPQAYYNIYFPF